MKIPQEGDEKEPGHLTVREEFEIFSLPLPTVCLYGRNDPGNRKTSFGTVPAPRRENTVARKFSSEEGEVVDLTLVF